MARNKEMEYYRAGMERAYRLYKDEGPEALEQAVRDITGVSDLRGNETANGFDVCIEAVGLPQTFQNCIDCAAFGGKVVLIGVGKKNLDFNFTLLQKKELNI